MAKCHEQWTVLPHDPIVKRADNLWTVVGDVPGMPLRRTMSIARLKNGDLVIYNAIALGDAEMREIEAWGRPAYLIVPNGYHRLDAKAFKQRYPGLLVGAPAGARAKVSDVVQVDFETAPWQDSSVEVSAFPGTGDADAMLRVTSADGVSLVINDVVFNQRHLAGAKGFFLRHVLGSSSDTPKVTRIAKWFMVKERDTVKAELLRLATTPSLRRVIVSHGDAFGPEGLAQAAASL